MELVTRYEWGARQPKSITRFTPGQLPTPDLILHHAGTSGGGAARVRAIQNFHMDSRGWRDIAYHYLIDSDGTVFEGRTWGVVGGATKGHNMTSHAVCMLGNFNNEQPTPEAVDALIEVVQWGHREGYVPLEITGGHRDYRPTTCPGSNLYTLIPVINEQVGGDDMKPPSWAIAATQWHIEHDIYTEDTPDDVDESEEFHRQTVFRHRFYQKIVQPIESRPTTGVSESDVKAIINDSQVVAPG